MTIIATKGGAGIALIGQSYGGASRTATNATAGGADDDDYLVIASVTIPAGTMGVNSRIQIVSDWDVTSSGITKFCAIDFGGTNVGQPQLTTSETMMLVTEIKNLNSLISQKTINNSTYGATANAYMASAVNTANAVTIDFKVKWSAAAGTDVIYLLGYSIWHYPGA